MSADHPRVSVVLPVFNDEVRLEKCLRALQDQSYPRKAFEVIVVDNASTSDIRAVVERFPGFVYTYEGKQGSYAARNKGLTLAGGEIIAFTDSDCVPAPDWLEKGVATLRGIDNCGLVGGAINLFYKDAHHPTGVELYENVMGFPQQMYIQESKFGATANVFTWRSVIDAVGDFNAELKSGGDSEWGKRVHTAGYSLHYADNVVVGHPARSTYAEMLTKTRRVMSGLPAIRDGQASKGQITLQLLRGLLPPLTRVRNVLAQAPGLSLLHKAKLAGAVVFIRYVWVLERARIQYQAR